MPETTTYSLVFLFDGTQTSQDELRKDAVKAMGRHEPNVTWDVIPRGPRHLVLSIGGPLQDVDACHQRINDRLMARYACIRLCDQAGEDIRRQAYPVVARIERQLRAFVHRAMTESQGLDWWKGAAPFMTAQRPIQGVQKVDEVGQQAVESHPLESAGLNDLVAIITTSVQQWSARRPLSVGDLAELLSGSPSIDDLQRRLAEQTRRISLWDDVLALYLRDERRWKGLKKTMAEEVLWLRDTIAYQRPMYLWQQEKLIKIARRVDALLASASERLSPEKRVLARQASQEWASAVSRALDDARIAASPRRDRQERGPALYRAVEDVKDWETSLQQQERLLSAASRILDHAGGWETVSQRQDTLLSAAAHTLDNVRAWEAFRKQRGALSSAVSRTEETTDGTELSLQEPKEQETLDAAFVGSVHGARFHLPRCRHARQISPVFLIAFENREQAASLGYRPCKTCSP